MYGDFYTIKDFKLDLDSLVKDYKCEYVDCLNYGLPRKYFLTWGFNIKKDEVIPEYFEPFIQKNRSILYAYKTNNSNYFVFKADCDQDRPNI